MRPRSPHAPLVALVLATLLNAGCKDDPPPPSATGAWLSADSVLLLRIHADDTVDFEAVAGGGSCLLLGTGTIDREHKLLLSEYGDRLPYVLKGDVLTLRDPTGELGGDYHRTELSELCYVNVPPLGEQGPRVTPRSLGASVNVAGGVGRELTVDVPADAVSFGVYLFGDNVGSKVYFTSLRGPDGVDALVGVPDLQYCSPGFCSLVVPKTPTVPTSPGRWTAVVAATDEAALEGLDVRTALRPGPLTTTTITLRPFVTTDIVDTATLEASLEAIANSYATEHGITLEVEPIIVVADRRYRDLFQDFLQPSTAALLTTGGPDVVNIFLAETLIGGPGVLGIASGIPASFGVAGPFNGLLVDLDYHLDDAGVFYPALFEETIAHELGHMVGLFHTTESDGSIFDPLADTPECRPALFDTNADGTLHADECAEADGHNLMFWTPGTTTGAALVQGTLTPDQRYVIERSLGGW